MINYMKNFDFVRVIENEKECALFNDYNLNSVIIKKEVFELIRDVKTLKDLDVIANEFCEDDRTFFIELKKVLQSRDIFIKNGIGADKFKRINYIITDFCNLYCRHCCYSAKYINENNYVTENEFRILNRIISLKPEVLTITGGEPLTISNFSEVIKMVKKSGIKQKILQTNATLISERNVKELSEGFNGFDISLDGTTAQETESIRGKGVYEKVIYAIDLLKEKGITNILLSCAMDVDDIDKRSRFEKLCKELDVKAIVRQMTSTGRAKENNLDTKDKKKHFFYDMYGQYCNCSAGRSEITVNNKGEVFPCVNFIEEPFSMGNIFDDNILNMLGWDRRHLWYQNFSEYVSTGRKECSDCEVNLLCWTCPFQVKNYIEFHKINNLSEICENKKKAIYRRLWDAE